MLSFVLYASILRWFSAASRYLSLSQALLILKGLTALPPRRSPLVLRLFALALADGSGLPFSLYPPPAALESQTPQREPRALPRRAQSQHSQGSREVRSVSLAEHRGAKVRARFACIAALFRLIRQALPRQVLSHFEAVRRGIPRRASQSPRFCP